MGKQIKIDDVEVQPKRKGINYKLIILPYTLHDKEDNKT